MSGPSSRLQDRAARESAGPAAAEVPLRSRPWILAATIIGSSMVFIDATVVNVAVPAMQAQFGRSAADVQWIVEAYALMLSALLLVGGSLGDRHGRRRMFSLGIAGFAAASLWCALSTSFAEVVIARAVQGAAAALLVPGSLAIITASFPESERGRAIGTWSGFSGITTALGPVLGGWLIENLSWRAAFFVNLPLAAVVLWMARAHVPESHDVAHQGKLDWTGAVLATVGLGLAVYALLEFSSRGLGDPVVLGSLAVAALALLAFWRVEHRATAPMLPLDLFRSRNFSGANLLTLLLYAALGGGIYFLPLNLIQLQHYSATAAGASLLPFILIMFALSRWAGGSIERFGARAPLTIGPAIAAAGFALLAWPGIGGGYFVTFFPGIAVLGLGMAIAVAPLTTTVMNAVPLERAGVASGINNAVSRVAGLLALALLGVVLLHVFDRSFAPALDALNLPREAHDAIVNEQYKLTAATLPASLSAAQRGQVEVAIASAYATGFRAVMLVCAALALAGGLVAWTMIAGKRAPAKAQGV